MQRLTPWNCPQSADPWNRHRDARLGDIAWPVSARPAGATPAAKTASQCGCYAINGGRVCRIHGGAAPQVRRKADERLLMARAYRIMVTLTNSPSYREHEAMRKQAFPSYTERRFLSAVAARFEAEAGPQ